jgi:hypothetical protein
MFQDVPKCNGKLKNKKMTNEKKLIKYLIESYPVKWGRPSLDGNTSLMISFGMTLVQILDLVLFEIFSMQKVVIQVILV